MMVTVDGRAVERAVPPGCTLQELIDGLLQTELEGRLVISVSMDGHQLGDHELNARLGEAVPAGVQLELGSSSPAQLVVSVLESLAQGFAEAAEAFPEVADRLAGQDAPAAIHDVGRSLAAWQTCYRALAQCGALLHRDLLEDGGGDRSMSAHLNELTDKLNELRSALESRDTVLLADLVRYELPPLARQWQQLLAALAERLDTEHPADARDLPAAQQRAR
jgi:hypothetical protein